MGRRRYTGPPPPPPPRDGIVSGVITIVQEDRFRLVDDAGRGYLFVTRARAAAQKDLERWRDGGIAVVVRYYGVPDVGALAREIDVAR